MSSAILQLCKVNKSFGDNHVLRDLDLEVAQGDVVAILGGSGSGKSTMLRTINGMESIDSGEIRIAGEPLPTTPNELALMRRRVGMVFQQFNLFPAMTVLENVIYGPLRVLGLHQDAAREHGRELLGRVGMERAADQDASSLSGGQKQRVAIARALAMSPDVLLFDEPTSALDPEMVGEVLDVMAELASHGNTMVVVTHEMGFARRAATSCALLAGGRVREQAPPDEFFQSPRTDELRAFLSHVEG